MFAFEAFEALAKDEFVSQVGVIAPQMTEEDCVQFGIADHYEDGWHAFVKFRGQASRKPDGEMVVTQGGQQFGHKATMSAWGETAFEAVTNLLQKLSKTVGWEKYNPTTWICA